MSVRTERVARLIQREIASLILRDLDGMEMCTITQVRVSRDLSIAYISVSVLGSTLEERRAGFERLASRKSQMRGIIGRRIRHQVKAVPDLRFFLDETEESARKMDELLDRIRAERQLRTSGA